MFKPDTGLKITLAILIAILIIGVIGLILVVINYDGNRGQNRLSDPTATNLLPQDLFPEDSPTKDASKMIISEVRNNPDGSIASVVLILPPSMVGLSAEINGIPVISQPVDTSTILIDAPIGIDIDRVEVLFKAGPETRASCILHRLDLQRTEGDCIW